MGVCVQKSYILQSRLQVIKRHDTRMKGGDLLLRAVARATGALRGTVC
jgi:hypothetical protein